jgi:hypothetical protein
VSGYLDLKVSEEMLYRKEPIPEGVITAPLDAAHIIPHARNDEGRDGYLVSPVLQFLSVFSCLLTEQSEDKKYFWTVFNMFHPGLPETLSGVAIDQVSNGILLNHDLHVRFGALKLYFEPVEEGAVSDKSCPE